MDLYLYLRQRIEDEKKKEDERASSPQCLSSLRKCSEVLPHLWNPILQARVHCHVAIMLGSLLSCTFFSSLNIKSECNKTRKSFCLIQC